MRGLANPSRSALREAGCEPPRRVQYRPTSPVLRGAPQPTAGRQPCPSNTNRPVAPIRRAGSERCRSTAPGSHSLLIKPLTASERF